MDTEEIMKRLRQPAAYTHKGTNVSAGQAAAPDKQTAAKRSTFQDILLFSAIMAVIAMAAVVFFSMLNAKNRAENVSEELDADQIDGLVVQQNFNPNQDVTYIQISEGQDRNVAVSNLGTTLPIISSYNYKSFTSENFQVIGTAPWALTTNFSANLNDPAILQYLLSNNDMIQAFLIRPDVTPLLDSPQELAAFVKDTRAMKEFFEDDTIQEVLARPHLLKVLANSRFMSFLLISESGKYYRTHPQEAAELISSSPYLRQLQADEDVAQIVRENRYLAKIADKILTPMAVPVAPQPKTETPKKSKKGSAKKSKKS